MPEKSNDVKEIETDLYNLKLKSKVTQLNDEIDVCLTEESSTVCGKSCLESYVQLQTVSSGKKLSDVSLKQASSNDDRDLSKDQNDINKTFIFNFDINYEHYVTKDIRKLESYSLSVIKVLAKKLSKAVEDVSSQLVMLLQENDSLQQESDARNVAIEQLLRLTVKETENELKPIQMSVILSDEDI